jgi:hypothetical protein
MKRKVFMMAGLLLSLIGLHGQTVPAGTKLYKRSSFQVMADGIILTPMMQQECCMFPMEKW